MRPTCPARDASQAAGPPWMVATRIRIGIAQINLNAALPLIKIPIRGYPTENWNGPHARLRA